MDRGISIYKSITLLIVLLVSFAVNSAAQVTLTVIDKSGGEAISTSVETVTGDDPLPVSYKSPFAKNYNYYATASEAQDNNGTALDASGMSGLSTVYVGYDVDTDKMGSDMTHVITARSVYMHMTWRLSQGTAANQQWIQNQQYDVSDIPNNASAVVKQNNATIDNYALMDNAFVWQLGDDPYNVTFKNKGTGYYANPIANASAGVAKTSTGAYCVLYWTDKNGNTNTSAEYCRVYYRGSNGLYVTSRTNDWIAGDTSNGNYTDGSKIYIKACPTPVTINVLNAEKQVECQLEAYINSSAKMETNVPFSLLRAYTTNHALHYGADGTDDVTMGVVPDASKLAANGYNLYLTYDIDETKWRTATTQNTLTTTVHSYQQGDDKVYWYLLRGNGKDANCMKADKDNLPTDIYNTSKSAIESAATSTTDNLTQRSHWALIGTPYHLQLAEQYHGLSSLMGYADGAVAGNRPKVYDEGAGSNTVWEVSTFNNNNTNLFFRPQGSLNGQSPRLYLSQTGTLSEQCDNGSSFDFYLADITSSGTQQSYNLVIVDKEGNEALTVADVTQSDVTTSDGDPLPRQYRSPYAENYKYYNSKDEAQANQGTETTWDGETATVYVGYDVKSDFTGDQFWTIWNAPSKRYMHAILRTDQTASTSLWWMRNQNTDPESNVTTDNLPFLDNTFAWQFGDSPDPYNVKFFNKGARRYINQETTSNNGRMEHLQADVANATPFSILYYGDDDDVFAIYNRSQNVYVAYNNSDGGRWVMESLRNGDSRKFTFAQLPALSINVVDQSGSVEATLQGYFKSGCTWSKFTPFYLKRIYTSNHTFYYDEDCQNEVAGTVDDDAVLASGAVFVKYDLASNWGTLTKTENTADVAYSPDENSKMQWYAIKTESRYLVTSGLQLTDQRTGIPGSSDSEADKRGQWAFVGTPYSLKLVNRYHGTNSFLAIPSAVSAGNIAVEISEESDDMLTTWEVCTGLGNQTNLQIRPQRSYNGESTFGFLGFNSGFTGISPNPNGNLSLTLTWLKETDAKNITFKLYAPDGSYMAEEANGSIADNTQTGYQEGDDLAEVFGHTGLLRRFCEYKFYSDADFTAEVTEANADQNETVYVQWQYAADAPVFSNGTDARDYQYYMINVSNGSYSYQMDVVGSETEGYSFVPKGDVQYIKDYNHQFALVGTPYSMRLYSRYAGKFIAYDDGLTLGDGTGLYFELPEGDSFTSTQMVIKVKSKPQYIKTSASSFFLGETSATCQLVHLIVPVRVFKDGETAFEKQLDYREYALSLNPDGTPRATDARMVDTDLSAAGNSVGTAYDFRHAFCDYTFYHTYNWTTGELSDPIPSSGDNAGLPFYGGSEQYKRAFFATYTVDEEQFGQVYLLSNQNNSRYFGKGSESSNEGMTYTDLTSVGNETSAKDDTNQTYRWYMTGDPYNLQLINLGTGDDYETKPLGAQHTSDKSAAPTKANGRLMMLSNDETYTERSHWEIIDPLTGSYVFFLTADDADGSRYSFSLSQHEYSSPAMIAFSGTGYLNLTPAEEQYTVTWYVVDNDSHEVVASAAKSNLSAGTQLTIDDLPDVLRRHFCDYEDMFGNQDCTSQYAENTVTVEGATAIYVPYTIASGSPKFYPTLQDYNNTANEDRDPCLIRMQTEKYVRDNNGDAEIVDSKTEAQSESLGKWVLIGNPYKVQFYNDKTQNFIYIDMTAIQPDAAVPVGNSEAGNSYWTLLDDATSQRSAICLYESDNQQLIYLGHSNGDLVMNLLSDRTQATGADFIGSNGVDGVQMVLTYGENTLRENGSVAGNSETFAVAGYYGKGTKLVDVMPAYLRRAFCNYAFKYNDEVVDDVTADMCNDHGTVTIYVTYTVESPFEWSSTDKKHWYYLVNNHIQGSEKGKMVYLDDGTSLHVNTGLIDSRIYLYNSEWCVMGDPYGFRMLNRYDPDKDYNAFVSVTGTTDKTGAGYLLRPEAGNANSFYEMMTGKYAESFWIHPIYTAAQRQTEPSENSFSYVDQNYNGSASILPTVRKTLNAMGNNASANFRLMPQTDAVLAEYVKYAGFVGGLKAELVSEDLIERTLNGTLTDSDREQILEWIDDDANIVEMKQGYYRIVPFTWEDATGEHHYLRSYLTDDERLVSNNQTSNLKLEDGDAALYDPASIFWFSATTSDTGDHPRYYIKAQGLNLMGGRMITDDEGTGFKSRYENVGCAMAQLQTTDGQASGYHYMSLFAGSTEANTRGCFEMYKSTRLYLQPVGEEPYAMPLRLKMNEAFGKSYSSLYVPFDVRIADDCDVVPYVGKEEHHFNKDVEDVYTLYCLTLDYFNEEWGEKFIPAGTPVVMRSNTATGTDEGILLSLTTDEPTDNTAIGENKIQGYYLGKVDTRASLYTFGREKKNNEYTGRVGFFKRSNVNKALNPNRVFYISPNSASSKGVTFDFVEGETNGISGVVERSGDAVCYDMQGRRVEKPAQKGIYILRDGNGRGIKKVER